MGYFSLMANTDRSAVSEENKIIIYGTITNNKFNSAELVHAKLTAQN